MQINNTLGLVKDPKTNLVEVTVSDLDGTSQWAYINKDDAQKITDYLNKTYGLNNQEEKS